MLTTPDNWLFQPIEIDRLGDELGGAVFIGMPPTLIVAVGRHHHDRQIGPAPLDLAQQRQPVHSGHVDVGQDDDQLRLDLAGQLI